MLSGSGECVLLSAVDVTYVEVNCRWDEVNHGFSDFQSVPDLWDMCSANHSERCCWIASEPLAFH